MAPALDHAGLFHLDRYSSFTSQYAFYLSISTFLSKVGTRTLSELLHFQNRYPIQLIELLTPQ